MEAFKFYKHTRNTDVAVYVETVLGNFDPDIYQFCVQWVNIISIPNHIICSDVITVKTEDLSNWEPYEPRF